MPSGFGVVRYAQDSPELTKVLQQALKPNSQGEVNALALSGGGANGAFGAGVLTAWAAIGDRPEFQMVTGVSTGALTAPLAFLGDQGDQALKQAYLGPGVQRLLRSRGPMGLFTPGLYSRKPLVSLVRSYVTDDLLRQVAAEHAKGRRLLVASTNLDTEQLIVWDMGAIASHGGLAARDLFVSVLVASASVPGVFPPTLIDVDSDGHRFSEMHVDGQTQSAFFAVPTSVLLGVDKRVSTYPVHFYVIVNGQPDSLFAVTRHATLPILGRSFDAASKAATRDVLITTAEFCQHHGCTLRVSSMPVTETDDPLDFHKPHLQRLFDVGQAAERSGSAWRTVSVKPAPLADVPTKVDAQGQSATVVAPGSADPQSERASKP